MAQLAMEIDAETAAPPSVVKVKQDPLDFFGEPFPPVPGVPGGAAKKPPGSDPLRTPGDDKESKREMRASVMEHSSAPSTIPRRDSEPRQMSSRSRGEIESVLPPQQLSDFPSPLRTTTAEFGGGLQPDPAPAGEAKEESTNASGRPVESSSGRA